MQSRKDWLLVGTVCVCVYVCVCVCVCVWGGGLTDCSPVLHQFLEKRQKYSSNRSHTRRRITKVISFLMLHLQYFFFFVSCWLKFCLTPRRFRWSLCFTGRSCTLFWGITTALLKGNAQRSTSGFTFVVSRLNILCLLKIVKVTHSLFCFLWARKRFGFRFLYGSNWTRSGKQTSHVRRRRAGFTWQV